MEGYRTPTLIPMRLGRLKHTLLAFLTSLCLFYCPGLLSHSTFAQDHEILSPQLEDAWFSRKQLLNQGKQAEADVALERIKQLKVEQDIDNLDFLAASLLREAQSSLDQGNANRAVSLTRSAIELAPNFPISYFFLFKVLIRPDQLFLGEAIDNYFSGWHQWIHNFMAQLSLLNALIMALLLSLLVSYGFFFVIILIHITPLLGHEVAELIRGPLRGPLPLAFAIVILALPMFWGLKLGWIITFWVVLGWFYLSTRERIVAASFIVFLGLSGAYLPRVMSMVNAPSSLELRSLIQAIRGEGDPSVIEELRQTVDQEPDRWEGYFALAQLQKKAGTYETALKYYQQALRKQSNSASILNNMGNAYFYLKDYNHAVDYYQQALDKDPSQVATYYNLSQTFREMLLFDKGEQIYQEGRRRDKDQMDEYTKRSALSGKVVVVDTSLPVKALWTEVLTVKARDEREASLLFGAFFDSLPIESAPGFMMGALIILVVLSVARKKATIAFECPTCSRIACKKCQRSLFELSVCHRCWANLKETKRRGEIAQAEEQLIRKRQIALIMTLLLPGSGHFYLRQALHGFLFSCLVAFLLLVWWFGAGVTYHLSKVVPTTGLVSLSITLMILIASYYLILKHMIKLGTSLVE
jgi:tetratricopeptide (TPR) repeat protein